MNCGLDFGTSNSALSYVSQGEPKLAPLEQDKTIFPTTVFYHEDRRCDFGAEAIAKYLDDHPGRLMRSIKSILGTDLITEGTVIGERRILFQNVIADYLREIKTRAEKSLGTEFEAVVQGRPVHFVESDPAGDRDAEAALRTVLRSVGFKHIEFELEPIAAARYFTHLQASKKLLIVADIGGGTSDFSVVRSTSDNGYEVLASHGIRLGGMDFDRELSFWRVMPMLGRGATVSSENLPTPNWIYSDLASPFRINLLYGPAKMRDLRWLFDAGADNPKIRLLQSVVERYLGSRIAKDVEEAKIALSTEMRHKCDFSYIEKGLSHRFGRPELRDVLSDGMKRLRTAVAEVLSLSGVSADSIEQVVMTGGSTNMPLVHDVMKSCFPRAGMETSDRFGAVALGLALEAQSRFK